MNSDIPDLDIQTIAKHALALLEPRTLYVEAEPPEEAPIAPFVISYDVVDVQNQSTDRRSAHRCTEELTISIRQPGVYLKEIVRLIRTYHQDQIGENDWVIAAICSDAKAHLAALSALSIDANPKTL